MAGPFVTYGQDGLSATDANGTRRIWLDPAGTSLKFFDAGGVLRLLLDGLNPGLNFYDSTGARRLWIDGVNPSISFSDGSARRIFLDAMGSLFSFFDGNGTTRCQIGNLPANGISAAGWGFRVNDSAGNPLYDSTGVIDAMTSLGISQAGPGQTITSTSFITTTPAINITFTLTRTTRCKFDFLATAKSTVAAKVGYVRLNLVGVGTTGNLKFGGGTGTMDVTNGFGWLYAGPGSSTAALPAGTYTCQLEVSVDAGGSMYFDQGVLEGWRLGG
jgi:hypothetical protein